MLTLSSLGEETCRSFSVDSQHLSDCISAYSIDPVLDYVYHHVQYNFQTASVFFSAVRTYQQLSKFNSAHNTKRQSLSPLFLVMPVQNPYLFKFSMKYVNVNAFLT